MEPPTNKAGVFTGGNLGGWSVRGLDKPLADCYDTLAGQGVRGSVQKAKPKKGIPALPAFAVGIALLLVVVIGGPMLAGKAVGAAAKSFLNASQPAVGSATNSVSRSAASLGLLDSGASPGPSALVAANSPSVERVRLTGVYQQGTTLTVVMLSDGRQLGLADLLWCDAKNGRVRTRDGSIYTF